ALVVAIAFAPTLSNNLALPESQAFGSKSKSPCKLRNIELGIGLLTFVMDVITTAARSRDFHREMFGCERLQKIPRVEDLRRRADSLSLEVTVKDARGSFDNDRRRDRVNVTSAGDGSAFLVAAPRD